ncbi:MAG: hypothetical protein NZM09_05215 [Ignavibacterium sp.]|nr:hypothetical protein [Ignavibacterium sp.]MDW8375076.1 hypothetical protein [Ignavibacteriales bacterium]
MKYKNLNISFLYEVIIGFGCIISISQLGFSGIFALSLIALKPILLEREPISDEKNYWRFSYRVLLSSVIIILIFITTILALINFIPYFSKNLPPLDQILYLLIPFFIMTRGVIGFIYNQKSIR